MANIGLITLRCLLLGLILTGVCLSDNIYGQISQSDPYYGIDEDSTGVNGEKPKWEFGVFGGLLFSKIGGDLTESHSYKPGFGAGFSGSVEIFHPLGLMVELYYAGLGTGFASIGDNKLNFNYLVLPIMFTHEFRPQLSFAVGPYFGYLAKAFEKGDDFEDDVTNLINRLDVGVKLGLYYQASRSVDLGISFKRGFINTQRGERVSSFKQYNLCLMFTTSVNLSRVLKPQ